MANTPFKMKGISPLKHPEHKDHHPKKKKTENQKKKELLKKYPGGVMPL